MIEIPWSNLEAATLRRMLEEIVTRDGTDYGAVEVDIGRRIEQAMQALRQGRAQLVWDEATETASLLERR